MMDNENFIFILTIAIIALMYLFMTKYMYSNEKEEYGCILGIFKMLGYIVIVITICVTLIVLLKT
jgi:hypothetical protein